jgi:hypothetical protein
MPKDPKELAAVLPLDDIRTYFSNEVAIEQLRKTDIDSIENECASDLFLLAINCAIRAKQIYQPDLDLNPLAPYIPLRDPKIHRTLGLLLGQDPIDDIYCCRCTVNDQLVASHLIAQVWPRDLYMGMVMFADPAQPIAAEKRKSSLQKFRGLGLLSKFIERVETCAAARGCLNITLIANETTLMTLFSKYGFEVDSHPSAQIQLAEGKAIPMHKAIA